jgi:hypothetical protein
MKNKREEEDRHETDIGVGVRRLHVETRVTQAEPLSREDVRDLLLWTEMNDRSPDMSRSRGPR